MSAVLFKTLFSFTTTVCTKAIQDVCNTMPKSDVKSKPKVEATLGAYCAKVTLDPANVNSVTTLILSNMMWLNHFPMVCSPIVYARLSIK